MYAPEDLTLAQGISAFRASQVADEPRRFRPPQVPVAIAALSTVRTPASFSSAVSPQFASVGANPQGRLMQMGFTLPPVIQVTEYDPLLAMHVFEIADMSLRSSGGGV